MAVTFVCDLCGAPGRAPGPGSAQCATCGNVAFVAGPASAAPEREVQPGALAAEAPAGGWHDDVDLVLDREIVEPPPRLAELWTRPETRELPTPVPRSGPRPRGRSASRARPLRRGAVVAATFVAGAAFAVGAVMGIRGGFGSGDEVAGAASSEAAPPSASAGRRPNVVAPVGAPAPASARRAAPAPVARAERPEPSARAAAPATATPKTKPASVAAPAAATSAADELFASRATGFLDPAPEDRQCVPRALRALRREHPGRFPEDITVRFPVTASGALGRIDVSGSFADHGAADAIRESIRRCPFRPGADELGRPTAAAVVMRIRFPGR